MNLFLSPHNDDEALFGSYIIQTWHPLVLVVTDAYAHLKYGITKEQRIKESQAGMAVLGVQVEFFHIADHQLTEENLTAALIPYKPELVFAPALEGGHPHHDLVSQVADKLFTDVEHYSTYTRTRPYPQGPIPVEATDEMKRLKLLALKCYPSQSNLPSTRQYFITKHKDEFLWNRL